MIPTVRTRTLTERERAALTRLVEEHQSRLRAFLSRFEPEPAVVEELLQDVFIGVLMRVEELAARPAEEAARYLRGVARNLVRLRWRKLRRQHGEAAAAVRDLVERSLEQDLKSEEDDSQKRRAALRTCLEGLTERARRLIVERFFNGLPAAALARRMGASEAAVRMIFLRLRRQLRQCVEARLRGEVPG